MEETVIWEQHTVTLHRVGISYPPSQMLFTAVDVETSPGPSISLSCLSLLSLLPCIFLPSYFQDHVGSVLTVYTVADGTDKTEESSHRALLLYDSLA